MLRSQMMLQHLLCRRLVITVLTLVLQRAAVLSINMHVDRALVFLGILAVRAHEETVICAAVLEPLRSIRRRHSAF